MHTANITKLFSYVSNIFLGESYSLKENKEALAKKTKELKGLLLLFVVFVLYALYVPFESEFANLLAVLALIWAFYHATEEE